MRHSLAERVITGVITAPARRRFRSQTDKKISVLLDVIETFERQSLRPKEHRLAAYERVTNACLFSLLYQLDLTIQLFDQAVSSDDSRKNLYSRQLALLLHTGLEDLPAVLGKDFRAALLTLPSGKEFLSGVGKVVKGIAALSKSHSVQIKAIRNLALAHRNRDAVGQLSLIRGIGLKEITRIASDLDMLLAQLARVLTPVTVEMGKPGVILRHFANRAYIRVTPTRRGSHAYN